MAKLRISPEDLLRGKLIDPGWYPAKITKVDEHPSKAGDSINWDVTFILADGPFAGVPAMRTFNEKAPGFAINFLKACGAMIDEEVGGEFDMSDSLDCTIQISILNEDYKGRMINKVDDFRPLR